MSQDDYDMVARELEASVRRNPAEGLLLSGGLDTTLLAYILAKSSGPECITVAFLGAPAPDVEYAQRISRELELDHYVHYFDYDEFAGAARQVIRILNTFDPMEVRNSAAGYIALHQAKELGLKTVMTGDGADEMFGGYSFLFELTGEEIEAQLRRMWAGMRFSSEPMAADLNIRVSLPFLDDKFRAFAEGVGAELKVGEAEGRTYGKLALRKAFEGIVPPELLWRVKAPFEVGCGTTVMPEFMDTRIPKAEFAEAKAKYLREDRVTVRDKEHLAYYRIYREMFGPPAAGDKSGKTCPDCGAAIEKDRDFCITCGAYPV